MFFNKHKVLCVLLLISVLFLMTVYSNHQVFIAAKPYYPW